MIKLVSVTFGKNPKEYCYYTRLDLIKGATYNIMADNVTTYKIPVTVKKISHDQSYSGPIKLREITSAKLLSAPPRPETKIKNVLFNKAKGITTVVWCDNKVTMVKCHPDEFAFDKEKAIALCFMKRAYDNRGCFNNELKKWCEGGITKCE